VENDIKRMPTMGANGDSLRININHLLFILLASLLLRIFPLFNAVDWTDLYTQQAMPILKHLNIYSSTDGIFPYSPVSMFLPSLCAKLALVFKVPFYIMMRLPAIIADIGIALAIYIALIRIGRKNAFSVGLLYALNPVSILVCSFHGNIISIATLFSFLAYVVLLPKAQEKNYRLSALLLGVAIGFRGYPILLLPLFLCKLRITLGQKIEYALYATIPTALSFVPFLLLDYKSIFREVFAYSGFPDYGLAAILRAGYSLINDVRLYNLPGNLDAILSVNAKALFFVAYAALLFIASKKSLISLITAVFLVFYFIYTGISSQYLIWVLPFAFLLQGRMLKYYLIFATWALVNFYWIYHPYIIFGKSGLVMAPLRDLLVGEIISLSLLWLVCLIWAIVLLFKKDNGVGSDLL